MMMMQMMPMMTARMLSSEEPEERTEQLLEMVGEIVAGSTADLSDEEYGKLVDRLCDMLHERDTSGRQPVDPCCG